ncbi:MAG: TonB-dependent receptor [bacterium]|nr:TonB-dependent receptor [bacterium]
MNKRIGFILGRRGILAVFTLWSLVFLSLIGPSSHLRAQEDKTDLKIEDVIDMSLDDLLNIKVSVASKSEEKVEDAPSSVTVFTQEDIRQMGISDLEELLAFVPGFQVSRDIEQGTAFRISARGRSSALSESVLFLVDGQRINDLYTGGISILNRYMAVENIRQVEIIRGPGSALYGSNAFLGVVNIVTENKNGRVRINTGSGGYKNIAINVCREFSQTLRISAFIKAFSDKGAHYDHVEDVYGEIGSTDDPVKGMDATVAVNYDNFTFRVRHMERNLENFLTFGSLSNGVNREQTRQTSLSLGYKKQVNKKLDLDIRLMYQEDNWESFAGLIPSGFELAPGFSLPEQMVGGPYLDSYYCAVDLDAVYRISSNNTLYIGGSYLTTGITEVVNQLSHHPITLEYMGEITCFTDETSFNEENTRHISGLYIQDKQTMGKRLSLTMGFRYDRYNDFGGTLNPRAAVIYAPPWGGKIKGMYGRAFRSPNFLELYDKNNPVDFGNRDLKPEKVETFELAYIQSFKNLYVVATYFRSRIEDIIILGAPVSHPDNPLGSPSFSNSGEITITGLEVEFKTTPFKNMIVAGTYSHYFEPEILPVSMDTASFIVNYKVSGVNININGVYRGENPLLPDQGAYFPINAALRLRLKKGLSLTGSVKNIFDEEYRTLSVLLPNGVRNRGRSVLVGLDFDF